jgi:hypothetical protein
MILKRFAFEGIPPCPIDTRLPTCSSPACGPLRCRAHSGVAACAASSLEARLRLLGGPIARRTPCGSPQATVPQSAHPELDPFELAARPQRGSVMPENDRSGSVSAARSDPNAIRLAGSSGGMPFAGGRPGFPAPPVPGEGFSPTRRPGMPVPPDIIPGTPEWWEHAKRGHQGLWDFLFSALPKANNCTGVRW